MTLTVNGSTSATVNGVTVSNIAVSATGVVTANIVAASNATAASFTLRVTDSQGSFAQATLNVEVTSGSPYEADVDPRPNQAGNPFPGKSGDGIVSPGDVNQIRRFVLGFDMPDTGATNEFQKADSAPLSSFGDGIIAAGDVTQVRRYALGFNALQFAAGPTMPGNPSFSGNSFVGELFNQKPVNLFENNAPLNHLRTVTPIAVSRVGNVLTVGIVLNTNSGEILANALSFTLNFSTADLNNPTNIRLGSGGNSADLSFNDTQAGAGRLSILLDQQPQNTFGTVSQQLVLIDFTVATGAQTTTPLSFSDSTTPRFISDVNGNRLDDAETFTAAIVSVNGPKSRKRVRFF